MTTKTKLFSAFAIMLMALVLMPFVNSQPAYADDYGSGTVYVSPAHAGSAEVLGTGLNGTGSTWTSTSTDFEYNVINGIRLLAIPEPGRTFEGWYLRNTGQAIFTTIDIGSFDPEGYCDDSGHLEIVAVFDGGSPMLDVGPYNVTATAYPAGAGIVQVPVGPFDYGATVELKVTSVSSGYEFVGWMEGGEIVSTALSYSFPATQNRSLTARFRSATPYNVEVSPTTNGSVTPSPASAKELETVTLAVTPAQGYKLDSLTVEDEGRNTLSLSEDVDGNPTFQMPAGKATVRASFKGTVPVSMAFSMLSGGQEVDAEGVVSSATINGQGVRALDMPPGQTAAIHVEPATGYMVDAVRAGDGDARDVLADYSESADPATGACDIGFTTADGVDSALVFRMAEAVKATYDVNGGTPGPAFPGGTVLVRKGAEDSSLAGLASMVAPPGGRELDYVAVTDAGGTSNVPAKSLAGTGHTYDSDVTFTFFWKAEGEQGTYDPVSIQDAEVRLSATGFTYNGKVQKPAIAAIGGMALSEGTDYSAVWSNASSKNVGTYTVTITGAGGYEGTTKATYKIGKAANTLSAKAKSKKAVAVKAGKSLKAKKLFRVSKAQGKVTYKKAKGNKKITVTKNGKVSVKKGCKKGTYTLKVKVRAAGNANYNAATKTVKVKVRVR